MRSTNLGPEGTQTRILEHLPPLQVLSEALVPDVDLKLELAEGKGKARRDVRLDEGGESVELPALNIDLEDIDMGVTILLHESLEGVHGRVVVGAVLVLAAQAEGVEVGSVHETRGNFRAEGLDAEVVTPDLTVLGILEDLRLEGRLVVDTCRGRDASLALAPI